MKLDLSKLQNVRHLSGGKTTAQCPACAVDGNDAKKEHLVIYPDGRFGCVVYPKDKAHNKAILKLAGSNERGGSAVCRLSVTPMRVQESTVLMKVGRLGRVKPASVQPDNRPSSQNVAVSDPTEVVETRPDRPEVRPPSSLAAFTGDLSPNITDQKLREFLDLPVLTA